ncbi:MAG: hypothetical protein IPF65_08310 [Polaromonas sp.]|nr:hypothetical protein [Polaromonas sp.]
MHHFYSISKKGRSMHVFGQKCILIGLLCSSLGAWAQTVVLPNDLKVLPEAKESATLPVNETLSTATTATPTIVAPAQWTYPPLAPGRCYRQLTAPQRMCVSALVLMMTLPGIALFYGGMVRKKNVINAMASAIPRLLVSGIMLHPNP